MTRTRTSLLLPPALMLMLVLVPWSAGCATNDAAGAPPDRSRAAEKARSDPAPSEVSTFERRPYTGAWRDDPRLATRLDALDAAGPGALVRAEDMAGVFFATGRGVLVELVDEAPRGRMLRTSPRLVDGVRRPVLSLHAPAVVSGAISPADFAGAIVEAAVAAPFGDRRPPDWLTRGAGIELSGSFDRVLERRALAGPTVVTAPEELVPTDAPDDPLAAALRVRALLRIGRGALPLAVVVTTLAQGRSDAEALRAVGIDDPLFLDAAMESDRRGALAALLDDPAFQALVAARAALHGGDAAATRAALTAMDAPGFEASSAVLADLWIVRAQLALADDRPKEAQQALDQAARAGTDLIRLALAESLRARLQQDPPPPPKPK